MGGLHTQALAGPAAGLAEVGVPRQRQDCAESRRPPQEPQAAQGDVLGGERRAAAAAAAAIGGGVVGGAGGGAGGGLGGGGRRLLAGYLTGSKEEKTNRLIFGLSTQVQKNCCRSRPVF